MPEVPPSLADSRCASCAGAGSRCARIPASRRSPSHRALSDGEVVPTRTSLDGGGAAPPGGRAPRTAADRGRSSPTKYCQVQGTPTCGGRRRRGRARPGPAPPQAVAADAQHGCARERSPRTTSPRRSAAGGGARSTTARSGVFVANGPPAGGRADGGHQWARRFAWFLARTYHLRSCPGWGRPRAAAHRLERRLFFGATPPSWAAGAPAAARGASVGGTPGTARAPTTSENASRPADSSCSTAEERRDVDALRRRVDCEVGRQRDALVHDPAPVAFCQYLPGPKKRRSRSGSRSADSAATRISPACCGRCARDGAARGRPDSFDTATRSRQSSRRGPAERAAVALAAPDVRQPIFDTGDAQRAALARAVARQRERGRVSRRPGPPSRRSGPMRANE